ncbi:MAG: DNA gyrase C-terminal beta-propeller domain-containing protein [Clostridium sp.]
MIVTNSGIIIRISVDDIGIYSRNTQGVKLINVADEESVARWLLLKRKKRSRKRCSW